MHGAQASSVGPLSATMHHSQGDNEDSASTLRHNLKANRRSPYKHLETPQFTPGYSIDSWIRVDKGSFKCWLNAILHENFAYEGSTSQGLTIHIRKSIIIVEWHLVHPSLHANNSEIEMKVYKPSMNSIKCPIRSVQKEEKPFQKEWGVLKILYLKEATR